MLEAGNILLHRRAIQVGQPALFLDRDGVINIDGGYVHDPASVRLIDGAAAMVRAFNAIGWPVIVVSNQSGIGRGYFSRAAAIAVQDQIETLLMTEESWLDAVFLCSATPVSTGALAKWRKPDCGMFLAAEQLFGISLHDSIMVGDRLTDMQAAAGARLRGGFWLTQEPLADPFIDKFPVHVITSLEAVRPETLSVFTRSQSHG